MVGGEADEHGARVARVRPRSALSHGAGEIGCSRRCVNAARDGVQVTVRAGTTWRFVVIGAVLVGMLGAPRWAVAQYGARNGEWRSYGGDAGSTKYSPLDQIDAANFEDLEIF